jgi:predicted polyphosphate/ATP-dependent NAD kinase
VTAGPIGIIVNPASGKDIRRLVAHASVFDNAEKANIVRRVVLGAIAAGATEFLYMPDDHDLTERALEDFSARVCCRAVAAARTASALDTTRAAERMREEGCAVLVTLGGDGTNRAAAIGWLDAPLLPISTGTNNVFPRMLEGTVAGAAAGLIATGSVDRRRVSAVAKRIRVQIEGERDDLALVDAALLDAEFIGARALWDARALRTVVLTRADPAAVGLSAIGGLLDPTSESDDRGLRIEMDPRDPGDVNAAGRGRPSFLLHAPVAPGLYQDVHVGSVRRIALAETATVAGPGMLAFDGERERRLTAGQRVVLTVSRDGPRVIDVRATLDEAARRGLFRHP